MFVRLVDANGAPIPDLGKADLGVREDGRVRNVVDLTHPGTPHDIVVIANHVALTLPEVAEGLAAFSQAVGDKVRLTLTTPARDSAVMIGIPTDPTQVQKQARQLSVASIGPETIREQLVAQATDLIKRGAVDPVVLVITIDSQDGVGPWAIREPSLFQNPSGGSASARDPMNVDDIRNASAPDNGDIAKVVGTLQRGGVTLFVIAARHRNQNDHDPVLNEASDDTGGRLLATLPDSGIPIAIKQVTTDIVESYSLTYLSQASPRQGSRLKVAVNRPSAQAYAPSRVF